MAPEWLCKDSGLSSDDDLRQLQLQWLRDDIWMRRLVLVDAFVLQALSTTAFIIAPSTALLAGAGVTALIAVPLAYFFGSSPEARHIRRAARAAARQQPTSSGATPDSGARAASGRN